MQIFFGADHRGLNLKNDLIQHLSLQDATITDFGADHYDAEDDFNDYAKSVAKAILSNDNPQSYGILICGSAQGVCMQANRFKGIRAAICATPEEAQLTRQHNDANILCLSANRYDQTNLQDYINIINTFLETEALQEEKYQRRNQKLDED